MRVLVTGAGGFVGQAACAELSERGHTVIAATRTGDAPIGLAEARQTGDLADAVDNQSHLDALMEGVDGVLHLAARVHVMADRATDPLAEYRRINVAATQHLARAAARNGVQRFVFLSSTKVNGEATTGRPFTEDDEPAPEDAYGQSKWEAEQALAEIASQSDLETVILRPPLIYGAGVKANFLSLLRLCNTGLPLPFGGITQNRRSLLYIGNLTEAIATVLVHENAVGQTFLISDGAAVSTAYLVKCMRTALGKAERLLPVPPALLRLALVCAGRSAMADRLLGSLEIDNSRIVDSLGWNAPLTLQAGLTATAAWYRREGRDRG